MNYKKYIFNRLSQKFYLINHAIKICKLGSEGNKTKIIFLIILSLFEGLSDTLPVVIIIPFLTILRDPEKIWNILQIRDLALKFGLDNPNSLLLPSLLIFVLVLTANTIIKILTINFSNFVKAAIGHEISKKAYRKVIYSTYEFQISTDSSKIINDFNVCLGTSLAYVDSFLDGIRSLFTLFFVTSTLFIVNKEINFFIVLTTLITYLILAITKNKILAIKGRIIKTSSKKQIDLIQESWGSKKNIILENNQDFFIKRYSYHNKKNLFAKAKINAAVSRPKFIIEGLFIVTIGTSAYLLKSKLGIDPIPVLGSIALGLQKVLPSVNGLFQIYSSMRARYELSSSIENLIKETPQDIQNPLNYKKNLSKFILNKIELKNIKYIYPKSNRIILNDIYLSISRGDTLGIVGTTGSGKSTLINLLMGLIKPYKGALEVNGININDKENENTLIKYRKSISHVPQSIFLNNSSILENIAFGEDILDIDYEKALNSCKAACIFDFIERSENGLYTKVGERGIKLSGGQLQRIGIARALYRDAEILILDEATSSLDNKTEEKVIRSLKKYRNSLTIISIAHRLSTLYGYDRIIKVENGKVNEDKDFFDKNK